MDFHTRTCARELTPEAQETIRKSKDPSVMKTANGSIHTTEEATVYVYCLDMFVQVQLLKESPAALSLGKVCEEKGLFVRLASRSAAIYHQESENIECNTDKHVPVVPGVQETDHQTHALKDRKQTRAVNDLALQVEREVPEWLQPFMEGVTRESSSSTDVSPADVAVPPPALLHSARPPAQLASKKAGGRHNLFTRFPNRRIVKYADARKLRERHAQEILTIRRTELRLPKILAI